MRSGVKAGSVRPSRCITFGSGEGVGPQIAHGAQSTRSNRLAPWEQHKSYQATDYEDELYNPPPYYFSVAFGAVPSLFLATLPPTALRDRPATHHAVAFEVLSCAVSGTAAALSPRDAMHLGLEEAIVTSCTLGFRCIAHCALPTPLINCEA